MKRRKSIKGIFFDLNHPADFHFFKHLFTWMQSKNYDIKIVARDKECLHMLLDDAGLSYTNRGSGKHTLAGKYIYSFRILSILLVELIRFRPNTCMSLSSPYLAVLSRLLGIICITYDDTDDNPRLLPLIRKSKYVLSPSTYPHKFHKGHFHLPALKELAYLHPGQFQSATNKTGIFFRLTRTDSIHHSRASVLNEKIVVKKMLKLSRDMHIILSSEMDLDPGLDKSIHHADPIHIHKDLATCKLFWGNSATMAAEAAVLGIPAVFVSAEKFAYIQELEEYGLLFHYHPDDIHRALERLDSILAGDPPPGQFSLAHAQLIKDKVDMTAFMIWFIDTLPESALTLKKDPTHARRFIS